MKKILLIAAILLAILNALFFLPAAGDYTVVIAVASLVLALVVAALAAAPVPPPPAPAVPAPTPPPAPAKNAAEAEIVAFFSLLQEKGRLLDFLMDDVTAYDDSQVGAAARVVHQGCQDVMKEHFSVSPIAVGEEGSSITVPAGFAADEYRFLGKVSGQPPFTGTLIHKGWKTSSVKLPRITQVDSNRLPTIAPAEVELK